MARAAKTAGVQHVIWSSLDDTRKLVPLSDDRMRTLMGKYKLPHYDAKGEADHLFTDAGVPTTFLPTSFHWDSLIYFGMGPQRGEDGKIAITLPVGDKKLPGIAVADSSKCAYGSLDRGGEYIGKTVGIAGEHLTGARLTAGLTAAFGFPGAEDLGNMFRYKRDFEAAYCGARYLGVSRSLEPEPKTFAPWLAENKDRIPMSKRPGASTPAWRD